MAHTICKVTRCAEDRAGASGDFSARLSEQGDTLTARHQLGPDLVFELADLHGERGLTHRTFFRRPTEASVSGQCVEVAKLPKGQQCRWPYSLKLDLT